MATNLNFFKAIQFAQGMDHTANPPVKTTAVDIKRAAWAGDKFLKKNPEMTKFGVPVFTLSTGGQETIFGADAQGQNNMDSADLTATDWQTV